MEIDYFFMFLGIILVVVMIHFLVSKFFKKTIEELDKQTEISSETGIGSKIDNYDKMLHSKLSSLINTNNIGKYKSKYLNALTSLNGILNQQLLQECLSCQPNDLSQCAEKIGKLNTAINAINENIQYVEQFQ